MDPANEISAHSGSIYESLDSNPGSFRLLKVCPDLDGTGRLRGILTKCPRKGECCPLYTALSYAWGNANSTRPILVNGHLLEIGENLCTALMHLRTILPATTLLWIDAICINQNDTQERSEQVEHMREIYSNANEVVVWLGPGFEGCDKLFAYMREHKAQCFSRKPMGGDCAIPPDRELSLPLETIVRLPYWERYWIVQEFVLARNTRLVCGFESVRRADFLALIYQHSSTTDGHFVCTPLHVHPKEHYHVGRIVKIGRWERQESFVHLAKAMDRTRTSDATDPRDKVFAILGLVTEGAGRTIAVDYTHAPCTVYCTAIEAMMKDQQHKYKEETTRIDLEDWKIESLEYSNQKSWKAINSISPGCREAISSTRIYVEGTQVKHRCDGIECGSRAAMWLITNWDGPGGEYKEGQSDTLWN